jgi:hypothetical protein
MVKRKGITYLTPLEGNERCQSILNTNVGVADQVLTSMSARIAAGMASLATIAAKTPVAAQMAMWITWFATFAEEAEPLGAACLAKNGARRILYPVGKTPGAPPLNRLALRREFDWQKGLKYISPKRKNDTRVGPVALTCPGSAPPATGPLSRPRGGFAKTACGPSSAGINGTRRGSATCMTTAPTRR